VLVYVRYGTEGVFLLNAALGQENYFFDGPNQELNSRRVVLRVRLYDKDKKARLTLKVNAVSVVLRSKA
jgi:uncharacterized protein YjbK